MKNPLTIEKVAVDETRRDFLVRLAPLMRDTDPQLIRDIFHEFLVNGKVHVVVADDQYVTFDDDYITRLTLVAVLSPHAYHREKPGEGTGLDWWLVKSAANGIDNPRDILWHAGTYDLIGRAETAAPHTNFLKPEADFVRVMDEAIDEMIEVSNAKAGYQMLNREIMERAHGIVRLRWTALKFMKDRHQENGDRKS